MQEILHRCTAIARTEAIQPAFEALTSVVEEVLPVAPADVEEAKRIVLGGYGLSARDSLHLAVMKAHDINRILTFDTGFERYPGIERLA